VARYSKSKAFKTSNQAEYLSLLAGIDVAKNNKVRDLDVKMDSELVVKQVKGEYAVHDDRLAEYKARVDSDRATFSTFSITHVPRADNKKADALAKLASEESERAYKVRKMELWAAVKQGNAVKAHQVLTMALKEDWLPPRGPASSYTIHANHQGWTLAHEAVDNGHLEILKLLIERGGIDPNSSKSNGLTVAQVAAQKGSISMLGALVDRGASTDGTSTPALKKTLWAAVAQGDVRTIKMAAKAGLLTVPNCTNHQVGTSLSLPLERLSPINKIASLAISRLASLRFPLGVECSSRGRCARTRNDDAAAALRRGWVGY
jgi:hypothetical protein